MSDPNRPESPLPDGPEPNNKPSSFTNRCTSTLQGSAASALKNANGSLSVKVTPLKNSVVQVFDSTLKGKKALIRFDKPHLNTKIPVTTPHINSHPSIRNLVPDHTPISGAQLKGAEYSAKAVNFMNYIAKPLAVIGVAIDSYRIGSSVCDDYGKGSTRNTTKTAATVAGGWGGGYGGAVSGAALGSAIVPGLGTLVGAIVGGVSGGIGGSIAAETLVDKVGDTLEYDVKTLICKNCKKEFKCKIYLTGILELCPECMEEQKRMDGDSDDDDGDGTSKSKQKLHRSVLKKSSSSKDSDDDDDTTGKQDSKDSDDDDTDKIVDKKPSQSRQKLHRSVLKKSSSFENSDDDETDKKKDKPKSDQIPHISVLKRSSSFEDSDDEDYTSGKQLSDLHMPD